jgi:hypothetical protein
MKKSIQKQNSQDSMDVMIPRDMDSREQGDEEASLAALDSDTFEDDEYSVEADEGNEDSHLIEQELPTDSPSFELDHLVIMEAASEESFNREEVVPLEDHVSNDCEVDETLNEDEQTDEVGDEEEVDEDPDIEETVEVPPPPVEEPENKPKETPKPKVIQQNGLEFNMDEPWQRSLLNELQRKSKERNMFNNHHQPHSNQNGRMLVGHTESSDYAIEMCGTGLTLETTVSSICRPSRAQGIHRTIGYEDSTLFENKPSPKHINNKSQNYPSPRGVNDHHGNVYSPNGKRNNDKWIDIEPSDVEEELTMADDATAAIMEAANPGDACYCMGYNVMDMLMPPPNAPKSNKYRNMGRRINFPRQPHLGKVTEGTYEQDYPQNEEGGYDHGQPEQRQVVSAMHQYRRPATTREKYAAQPPSFATNSYLQKISRDQHDLSDQIRESASRIRETPSRSDRSDPDGVYHSDRYY